MPDPEGAWHPSLQAELVQTPRTQNPLWHSPFVVHDMPSGSAATHAPEEQTLPGPQWELLLQLVRHDEDAPLHVYGAHRLFGSVPAAASVHVPFEIAPCDCSTVWHAPVHALLLQ